MACGGHDIRSGCFKKNGVPPKKPRKKSSHEFDSLGYVVYYLVKTYGTWHEKKLAVFVGILTSFIHFRMIDQQKMCSSTCFCVFFSGRSARFFSQMKLQFHWVPI